MLRLYLSFLSFTDRSKAEDDLSFGLKPDFRYLDYAAV